MSGEPDALAIVNQLRDLAADPLNRQAIVQDQGCLPGLILFLDNPNPQVVYSALLAVRYLAECRANRERMRGELGMMQSLENVMKKTTTPGETKLLASEIYEILKSSSNAVTDQAEQASYRRKTQFFLGATNKRAKTVVLHIDGLDDALTGIPRNEPLVRTTTPGETKLLASEIYEILKSACNTEADKAEQASYRRKTQFFLGATNKCAKTVVLHIDGLDDAARRSLCEDALLKIKGVISFTFQMTVKRCVVRIRSDLKAEALGTAIASTKIMKAQQIVKGEDGDEVMISFEDASVEVEQNTDLPDYLPEEESPSKELDKAVSRVGVKQDASGWLSTAANFLTRSFYW
ncbi:UNVERIFIED_CONTAM: hypothetical protein FKN15_019059 [Acipenser sinensis]